MPIAISCLDCGFAARVRDHLGGRVVECPKCKAGIAVPAAAATAPPPAAPGPIGRPSPITPEATAATTPMGRPAADRRAPGAVPSARASRLVATQAATEAMPPAPRTAPSVAPAAPAGARPGRVPTPASVRPAPPAAAPSTEAFELDDDAIALEFDEDEGPPAGSPGGPRRSGQSPTMAPRQDIVVAIDADDDGTPYALADEGGPVYAPARPSADRPGGPVPSAGIGRSPLAEEAEAARVETRPTRTPAQILAAFGGEEIEPVRPTVLYRVGLGVVAAAMLVLPLIYLSLIALAAVAVVYHATHSHVVFAQATNSGSMKVALIVYVGPIVAGGAMVLFLLKPLFARPSKVGKPRVLNPEAQPLVFAFIDGVCQAVGAPTPRRVVVDCDVNASASFVKGPLAVRDNALTLTIGLPLVAGLDLRQFAGVLAHEFGHFSQGAGMRLTNLIRTINAWFARLVYERDAWDATIDRMIESNSVLLPIGLLSKLAIWLVRRLLWVLMAVGHGISCFMMRQMEYDADRYEARMVGSDVFESTFRRLAVLNLAAQGAHADLASCWEENRLADDLPRLILANVGQIPDEVREAVLRAGDEQRTGLFDTHPSVRDRVASARREAAEGIFHLEGPATDLFRDFDALSRAATLHCYRQMLGREIRAEALTPVAEVVRSQEAVAEGHRSLGRFYLDAFDPSRSLTLPPTPPAAPADPKAAARDLARARIAMVEARGRYKTALKHRRETLGRLVAVSAASDLLRAGFKALKPADFGLRRARLDEADAAREELEAYLLRLSPHFEPFEALVSDRLTAGLALLEVDAVASRVPDGASWRAEARSLYPAGAHIASRVVPALVAVMTAKGGLERALSLLPGNQENKAYIDGVLGASRRLHGHLTELKARLGVGLLYPFHHGDGAISLSRFVLPPELPGRDDVGTLLEVGGEAVDRVLTLHCRLIGRLALAVEEVERALGLPELPVPGDDEDDQG